MWEGESRVIRERGFEEISYERGKPWEKEMKGLGLGQELNYWRWLRPVMDSEMKSKDWALVYELNNGLLLAYGR